MKINICFSKKGKNGKVSLEKESNRVSSVWLSGSVVCSCVGHFEFIRFDPFFDLLIFP